MSEQNEQFHYTYSAAQQEEIEVIRKKYTEQLQSETDKMEQLRRLDNGVTTKAMVRALSVGILGALLLGAGMSLIMTDLGPMLGVSRPMIPGILIGLPGMAGVIAAYPLYQRTLKKERKKIAPQILKLTEELTKP